MESELSNGNAGTSSISTYIDLQSLTSPNFSPYNHANNLLLATNNPTDTTIDLTTPLSRALFDLQEIDTHIDALTSRSALDILSYTASQNNAAQRILQRVEEERVKLNSSYQRLESEVLGRYEKAQNVRRVAERSWEVLRLARGVQRILSLAKQFESAITESELGAPRFGKEDHRAILRASYHVLSFRENIFAEDGAELSKINLVKTVRGRIFEDGEARILDFARRVVREFSMSSLTNPNISAPSYREAEESRNRFTSAVHILFLLSPVSPKIDGPKIKRENFEPEYLLRALQNYLQTAITSSSAAIGRALSQLPTLERTLVEVSARCQNVVALEALLADITEPPHPLILRESDISDIANGADDHQNIGDEFDDLTLEDDQRIAKGGKKSNNLLTPLLHSLDTSSLPSYFWRSLASSLSNRVSEILSRGGIAARTLRSQRDHVRNEIRECVLKGSKMPRSVLGRTATTGGGAKEEIVGNWEREAAVMVGSVIGHLGR